MTEITSISRLRALQIRKSSVVSDSNLSCNSSQFHVLLNPSSKKQWQLTDLKYYLMKELVFQVHRTLLRKSWIHRTQGGGPVSKSDNILHPPSHMNQPRVPFSQLQTPSHGHFDSSVNWPGIQTCMEVRVNPTFCHLKGNEDLSHDVPKLTLISDSPFMWSVLDPREEDLEITL